MTAGPRPLDLALEFLDAIPASEEVFDASAFRLQIARMLLVEDLPFTPTQVETALATVIDRHQPPSAPPALVETIPAPPSSVLPREEASQAIAPSPQGTALDPVCLTWDRPTDVATERQSLQEEIQALQGLFPSLQTGSEGFFVGLFFGCAVGAATFLLTFAFSNSLANAIWMGLGLFGAIVSACSINGSLHTEATQERLVKIQAMQKRFDQLAPGPEITAEHLNRWRLDPAVAAHARACLADPADVLMEDFQRMERAIQSSVERENARRREAERIAFLGEV